MIGDPERAMLIYAELASVAARKKQMLGRDRFLVLAGIAATQAGWPHVAERCRELIAANAPRHIITHYPTIAEALRDEEFTPFLRQTERFCSPERGEHLLSQMAINVPAATAEQPSGDLVLAKLSRL